MRGNWTTAAGRRANQKNNEGGTDENNGINGATLFGDGKTEAVVQASETERKGRANSQKAAIV
jgi:hypothetical protein